MHPIDAVSRTNLYNMVLILLSIILAAIAVAASMIHTSFGILAGSGIAKEDFSIVKKSRGAKNFMSRSETKRLRLV